MSAKMNKLFANVHKVPQVPEVVRTLINQFNDPNIDMTAIAKNVEKEQVIALKVLRLVNSAAFALPRKVASIDEALVLLGMAKLKTLVIASGIVSAVPEIENFDIKQFWLDSFSTATYAKWLAQESQFDEDIAFTAGLLNGLGVVLIHLGAAKEAAEIEQRITADHPRPFIEKMRLGFTSQDVCAELCRIWKFSDELITPIEQSGSPLAAEPISKIACSIYISRILIACKNEGMPEEEILQAIPSEMTTQLGLSESFLNDSLSAILALESGLEGLID